MSQETYNFDVDELTFGQVEFLTDETGATVNEVMERLQTGNFYGRDLVVMLALAKYPDDPAAGMDEIRKSKIADIRIGIPETLETE